MKETEQVSLLHRLGQKFDEVLHKVLLKAVSWNNEYCVSIPPEAQKWTFDLSLNGSPARFSDNNESKLLNGPCLAAACAAHRTGKVIGFADIADEDIELANKIKSYYVKKYTLKALNSQITPWQADMLSALADADSNVALRKHIGLLVRLPAFYHDDMLLAKLKSMYNTNMYSLRDGKHSNVNLKFITSNHTKYGKHEETDVWLNDTESNGLCRITINKAHPAHALVEQTFSKDCKVTAHFAKRRQGDLNFNLLTNYTLD